MTASRLLLAAVLAALLTLALAASAGAATPRGFFGVMVDGPAFDPRVDLDAEARLMASNGVGTVRMAFFWRSMQPEEGEPIDFTYADAAVAAAARAGLTVFPTLLRAPAWATGGDEREGAVPDDPATYATFATELVRRYGRNGTFWATAGVPVRPIVSWQIWNEPDIDRYWEGNPWPTTYVRLLRRARAAIKGVDPLAQVVSAGLTNFSWLDLKRLYNAGGGKYFDAAAIHPFSRRPSNVLKIVRLARLVMRKAGDGSKPLVLSEISWSSGKGHSTFNYGWETSERGQAARVRQILPMLARARKRFRLQAFYWYTWLSPRIGAKESFSYAGLRRMRGGKPVSKPALHAFRAAVRMLR